MTRLPTTECRVEGDRVVFKISVGDEELGEITLEEAEHLNKQMGRMIQIAKTEMKE
jgi:hypothetical protein